MKHIVFLSVLPNLQLSLRFDDGEEGVLDLSGEPRTGVFEAWNDPDHFAKVEIGDSGRSLVWPNEVDLCADSLWLQLTGRAPEEVFPGLASGNVHA